MHLNLKTYLLLVFALFSILTHNGQESLNLGRYPSKAFTQADFPKPGQFNDVCQDQDGIMYFATSESILTYDGQKFRTVVNEQRSKKDENDIVNKGNVYSILSAKDGKILIGKNSSFGCILKNKKGEPFYKTFKLSTFIEEMGSIYNILDLGPNKYLFVGEENIFLYNAGVCSTLKTGIPHSKYINTSVSLDNELLIVARDKESSIPSYYLLDLKTLKTSQFLAPEHIDLRNVRGAINIRDTTYLFDINNKTFYLTKVNNQYIWNKKDQQPFRNLDIHCIFHVIDKSNKFYAGTESSGVLEIDKATMQISRIFNEGDELQDLYINRLFFDKQNNLWCLQDAGAHFIELSSPVNYYSKQDGIKSNVKQVSLIGGAPLLSTANGLHLSTFANNNYNFSNTKAIADVLFQTEVYKIGNESKILSIGLTGIYEVSSDLKRSKLICRDAAWVMHQSKSNANLFYVGLDFGFGALKYENGNWNFEILLESETTTCRNITEHEGNIYFSSEKVGFVQYNISKKTFKNFKIDIDQIFKGNKNKINLIKKEISKSDYALAVFNKILFIGTNCGVFTFDLKTEKISEFNEVEDKFGFEFEVNRMFVIDSKLWISSSVKSNLKDAKSSFETGYLEMLNNNFYWTSWPFSYFGNNMVVNSVVKDNAGNIWFGGMNSIYLYSDLKIKKLLNPYDVYISTVSNGIEDLIANVKNTTFATSIPFSNNKMSFTFRTDLILPNAMQYKYKLDGYNDDWTAWSTQNIANFERLPEGTYTLRVVAKNTYNQQSQESKFEFTISPPWYRSLFAILLYVIAGIGLIIGITKLSTKRVVQQNIKLESTVKERTQEIEHQKEEIEKKNNDILDSIVYAKRIQQTILPSEDKLKRHFQEHFVFYRPKDIVSGDFYFSKQIESKIIFAAIDCTGHGVPGALVSIVGNNGLLRATNEFKLKKPSDILDKLREIVITSFRSQGQVDVKDGMDITLCSLDKETLMLEYAGANNECIIVRGSELIELKPDKQPIGQFIQPTPFTNHEYQLQKGDCVYLFTDGFPDQFGGEREKKYKSRTLKNLFVSMHSKNMVQQFVEIQNEFDNWKGEIEQVDDVCVFGIRI